MRAWHLMMIGLVLLIAGCSGGASTPQETPSSSATSALKSLPTFSFAQPTTPPQIATAAALRNANATQTAQAQPIDPVTVALGESHYEALACATCHGENAAGNDEGPSLLDYDATKSEFVTFMRSGGSLGEAHQYDTTRLSDTEATNLYQYLRSLQGS